MGEGESEIRVWLYPCKHRRRLAHYSQHSQYLLWIQQNIRGNWTAQTPRHAESHTSKQLSSHRTERALHTLSPTFHEVTLDRSTLLNSPTSSSPSSHQT